MFVSAKDSPDTSAVVQTRGFNHPAIRKGQLFAHRRKSTPKNQTPDLDIDCFYKNVGTQELQLAL